MVLSYVRLGNVMLLLEMVLISGLLLLMILLISKVIGMINIIINNSVIIRMVREWWLNMIFCKCNNIGQVVIIIVLVYVKLRIKG